MYGKAGIAQYQQVGNQAASYADPYELTTMLFNGALERIAQARGAIDAGDIARKGERIGKAISIVDGLRASLDHGVGGELAANLDALYDYCQRRLLTANAHDEIAALDEAGRLLREIKQAWDAIPADARRPQQGQANEYAGRSA